MDWGAVGWSGVGGEWRSGVAVAVECGVWGVECGVEWEWEWSGVERSGVECGVWSVECGVWSVECGVEWEWERGGAEWKWGYANSFLDLTPPVRPAGLIPALCLTQLRGSEICMFVW